MQTYLDRQPLAGMPAGRRRAGSTQHRETDRSAGLDNNAHALSKRPKRGIDLIDPALVQRVAEPAHRLSSVPSRRSGEAGLAIAPDGCDKLLAGKGLRKEGAVFDKQGGHSVRQPAASRVDDAQV